MIGDIIGGDGFVLTVWCGGMDFIDRLPKLESELMLEAELMVQQIEANSSDATSDRDH